MAFPRLSRPRLVLGSLVVALAPGLASAHALSGTSGWTDELVCAVPTVIMLVLVFILGRPGAQSNRQKSGDDSPGDSAPDPRRSD